VLAADAALYRAKGEGRNRVCELVGGGGDPFGHTLPRVEWPPGGWIGRDVGSAN